MRVPVKVSMFRCLPTVLVGCLLLPTAGTLHAADDYSEMYSYVSGGWHHWSSDDSDADGAKVRFGQQLTPFIGVEGHLGLGGKDSDTDTSLERLFGIYGKFILPLELISPYIKLGVTSASVEKEDESTSDFDFSYGIGTEINISPKFFIDLEYMVYLDSTKLELDGFTLGVGYKLP